MSRNEDLLVNNWSSAETDLSPARLSTYLRAMNGSKTGALRLYALNIQTSATLYCWLGFLEITLRNALIGSLGQGAKDQNFDSISTIWVDLTPPARASYENARHRLRAQGKEPNPSAIVTELPFGFWRYLLSSRYQNTLWRSNLRHAFPKLWPKNRATVYEPLEQAVELRNRIAHHEPIFRRELGNDLARIQQIIGWISPEALDWARVNLPRIG